MIRTINPVDNKILQEYNFLSKKEIDKKLSISKDSYQEWKYFSIRRRKEFLKRFYSCLKKNIYDIASIITQEMGKPIIQSIFEMNKSIDLCKYYYNVKYKIFRKEINKKDEYEKCYIKYDPIGTIIGIMPWNYPIWQIIRFSIPNLLLGNVIIIKPSLNTSGCSVFLERIFIESGIPKGVFQIFLVKNNEIEYIISSNIIQGVSFTGSQNTGSFIGSLSGKNIKKSVLELGGNDAFVVMKDVKNIKKIAKIATESRLNNTGQTCISAKRFVVDELIVDDFIDLVIQEMKTFHRGDLFDKSTKIGYISRKDLSDKLYRQYINVIFHGGKICLKIKRDQNFFSPSLLKVNKMNNVVRKEEIFGPIGIIISYSKEKEIPHIVNNTPYGLGTSIWTMDIEKAENISKNIDSGMVFINDMVKSDPSFPFGGVKKSGYGRELSTSFVGEFSNCKTVVIKKCL
ncbi:aldehyde dehydrogenase family protein [Blattabacterium cuenoti]|uniref:aldehyde dehydrogenase family protein n=1 Tax=Blattabacterium cuenoti TaxID=1653831 RepID=UPI00163CA47D|nr:aldehyde dehydrogenase family protein [Blattabacterium cuenoti]